MIVFSRFTETLIAHPRAKSSSISIPTCQATFIFFAPVFASLHNNFPFFCCSQQHAFISLPVSLQLIFGEAADAIVAMVSAAISSSHFVILFTSSPLFVYFLSLYLLNHLRSSTRLRLELRRELP